MTVPHTNTNNREYLQSIIDEQTRRLADRDEELDKHLCRIHKLEEDAEDDCSCIENQRVESTRLKELLDAHDCNVDTLNALQVENEGLRDENKALRDALEDIVALDPYSAKEIAREALKQGEKE